MDTIITILITLCVFIQVALLMVSFVGILGVPIVGAFYFVLTINNPKAGINMLPPKVQTLYRWSLILFFGGMFGALPFKLFELALLEMR